MSSISSSKALPATEADESRNQLVNNPPSDPTSPIYDEITQSR